MRIHELMTWLVESGGKHVNPEESLFFGEYGRDIHKALVCWMTTQEALRRAVTESCDLVICHETVLFPNGAPCHGDTTDYFTWETNRSRMALIQEGDLCVQRVHTMLDRICIYEDFAKALGLGEPVVNESPENNNFVKVFEIAPIPFDDLVKRTKQATGMSHLRVSPEGTGRTVSRIGLPWGGLGLSGHADYMAQLAKYGCDAFICGEVDNYAMHFINDSGVLFIETSHEVSENFGLKHFVRLAEERFPEVTFLFHDVGVPWKTA